MADNLPCLLRLPTEVLSAIVTEVRRSDLTRLMRVHSILHNVCIKHLYTFARIGVGDRSDPPLHDLRFLRHVRCLEILHHPRSKCWELYRSIPFTEPHSVEVIRYTYHSPHEHKCQVAVGLEPSSIVIWNPKLSRTKFKQLVPTTCWKTVQTIVLSVKPSAIPKFLIDKAGSWLASCSRMRDSLFDQTLELRVPTLTWILNYPSDPAALGAPRDVIHLLMRIGWAAFGSARLDLHQPLLFSCVIPDWILPKACLHVIRHVLEAHRAYNIVSLFKVADDSMVQMEVITMSEFLGRPGQRHILNSDEIRKWAEHAVDTPVPLLSTKDAVKWVQPEDWAEDDQETYAGMSLAEQYRWFPSGDVLRGYYGAPDQG